MNMETLLYDEIEAEFEKLRLKEPGTEEHKAIVDELAKLMDRAIEMEKVVNDCKERAAARESDYMEKVAARESEQLMKQQQFEDEKKDRLIKNAIGVAAIVLPLVVTVWGTKVSLKFEEEGTFTTIMGRGFISKLLPKK